MIAELEFDGPAARLRFDRATTGTSGAPRLAPACAATLT
jgi:hypothetical protein